MNPADLRADKFVEGVWFQITLINLQVIIVIRVFTERVTTSYNVYCSKNYTKILAQIKERLNYFTVISYLNTVLQRLNELCNLRGL